MNSDIPPAAEWYYRKSDSDIKAYGFSAILFATLTCAANITAAGNITAPRQYKNLLRRTLASLAAGE